MSGPDQSTVGNRLLRVMAAEDFARIRPHLRPCSGARGDIWFHKDQPIDTVWWMDSGLGSLIALSPEGHRVESGVWGRDGFAPVSAVLGADASPVDGQVQLPGTCWRMDASALREAVDQSSALRALLLRYVQTLWTQVAHTAMSNAVHTVDERLARWLLMCHDRVDGDDLPLTHDFLAVMLAVRRPSVTTALHVLEGNGFIRAERGCIRIGNRAAMEEFASDSYGAPEREYERLIGPLR